MKKNTLLILALFLVVCPFYIKANFVPGAFNGWVQNTPYSTTNMPPNFKRYTAQTSNDAEFKLLRLNSNWNDGWGSGYWINNWNTVWNLPHVTSGLSNAFVKNFGTNQWMSIITSTSLGQETSKFGFLKTSAAPISISSVSGGISNVNLNTSATVNITLSAAKCAEEYVLVRYTTDDWTTSSFITATGSGTSYSATIPAQTSSKTVKWYVMTSTVSNPATDTDYLTLAVLNNSGANYSYYTADSSNSDYFRSKQTGNWNSSSNWESSSTGSSNWVAATLVPGSSAASISLQSGHNITLNANVNIPSLTINSGATFTASDATPRTLTISKSASGSTTTLSNSGTWANGDGGSTVVFTGAPSSGDAVHAITGTIAFQNVIINKTSGSSNVGAGFAANSSVSASLEIGSGGYVSTDPPASFYGTNAVLKFNQGASATYNVNPGDRTWSTTVVPNSITINSGKVVLKGNRSASGTVIVDASATLEVDVDKQLTVGTITNNGTFVLKTGATVIPTTVGGSGTTNVEQILSAGRQWWYLSSPVTTASSSVFSADQIGKYVEDYVNDGNPSTTAPYFTSPFSTPETLTPGRGYVVKRASTAEQKYTFTGVSLNNGDVSAIVTRTGTTAAKRGFNLVGNPYPSYIDWDLVYDPASATNMRNAIWFRTYSASAVTTENPSGMTFHTYSDGDGVPETTSAKIAPMQAFWVKVNADGSNGTLIFKNTHREHINTDPLVTYNPLKVKSADLRPRLRLVVSNGTASDETLIVGKSYASNLLDSYDIEKMSAENTSIPEIFSLVQNQEMVINSMKELTDGMLVNLGFRPGQAGNYTLEVTQLENIDSKVVLVDSQTTTETELTAGTSYSFTSDATATTDRFSVEFRAPGAITSVSSPLANALVWVNDANQITVQSAGLKDARISVYTMAGQQVLSHQASGNVTVIDQPLSAGVYIVKLNQLTQKVVVQ